MKRFEIRGPGCVGFDRGGATVWHGEPGEWELVAYFPGLQGKARAERYVLDNTPEPSPEPVSATAFFDELLGLYACDESDEPEIEELMETYPAGYTGHEIYLEGVPVWSADTPRPRRLRRAA